MSGCWNRYKHKLSGTCPGIYSPIKPTIGHVVLKKDLAKTPYIRAHIWTLLNMEEFYYQNSGSLVIQNMDDFEQLNKKLSSNRNVLKWQDKLSNYQFMGQGSFGKVYKATDSVTSSIYAIKKIKQGISNNVDQFFRFIHSLLVERNTLAELNRCPFFVRLIAAYQAESDTNQNFTFIMEFCISDLDQFCKLNRKIISNDDDIFKYMQDGSLMNIIRTYASRKWTINHEKVIFIYFFEMLTALHYLATKRVVHNDLKPQNVLISQTGHIKIADMGLAFKDEWTYDVKLGTLPSEWNEEEQYIRSIGGTFEYYDPELVYRKLSKKDKPVFEKLQKRYKRNLSTLVLTEIKQNYLSDLFAVGLIMIDLTCGTYKILHYAKQYIDVVFWVVDLVYNDILRRGFLEDKLLKMAGTSECKISVIKLILSIFQPRNNRSKLYLAEQIDDMSANLSDKTSNLYIDIRKVENIVYYKKHKITKENVLNFNFIHMAKLLAKEIDKGNVGRVSNTLHRNPNLPTIKNLRINTFDYADF